MIYNLFVFFCSSNADKNFSEIQKITEKEITTYEVKEITDPVELFTACTKDALVVSEVFCLHADYRKDVPPPSKNLFIVHFCF